MDFCPDVEDALKIFSDLLPDIHKEKPGLKRTPELIEPCDTVQRLLMIFGGLETN